MGRTSHPFSNPFGKKEGEERPRKVRQGRFFEHDRNAPTAKFEKLHEAPREGSEIFRPPTENTDSEPSLKIEVISNLEEILAHEMKRVRWYLKEWQRYKELGYDSVIRFPAGINPGNANVSEDEIRAVIKEEMSANQADYEAYARTFRETWRTMREKMPPVMTQVYGFIPSGHFRIVPTAYGTGGGSLEKGGPVFFRLPKLRPQTNGNPITEIEAITHEILCHEVTAHLREGTAIDDSPIFATQQDVKELLMDYLSRTLLVRSGLMRREDVHMVGGGDPAAFDIDPTYYANPEHPDENHLRYEGRLPELVGTIEAELKNKKLARDPKA
ncbi:hypothetical protein HY090_00800 [Candidatus Kaiserbacteria bacterium]|nr:hypothetical protein [Candidatus Kaiserbacteria bacterium]